ncbi:MAG: hypothetical protein ABI067_07005 [Leifsonia sp.]
MIKANFKLADMQAYINQQVDLSYKAVISTFQFVGENFVRNARLNGNYNDITGNLRSSIGYIILQNGQQLAQNFAEGPNGTDRETGVNTAIAIAEDVAVEYPRGIVLICVAGMDYALYVENKGLDVITASSLEAQTQLKELLGNL